MRMACPSRASRLRTQTPAATARARRSATTPHVRSREDGRGTARLEVIVLLLQTPVGEDHGPRGRHDTTPTAAPLRPTARAAGPPGSAQHGPRPGFQSWVTGARQRVAA